jgi:hypothetical protein
LIHKEINGPLGLEDVLGIKLNGCFPDVREIGVAGLKQQFG